MNAKHTSGFTTLQILTLCLAVTPFEVSAVESGIDGTQKNTNIVVNSPSNWTVLSEVGFVISSGQTWHCVVTGSADAENPFVAPPADPNAINGAQYRFTLTIDDTAPNKDGGCERTLTLHAANPTIEGIKDVHSIASTCSFKSIGAGQHTIRWLALKAYWPFAEPDKALNVVDNSLTASCSRSLLPQQLVAKPKK